MSINIVQIQTALLLPITANFIVDKLEVKPERQEKRAMYWRDEDFTNICQKLIQHITAVRNADFSKIEAARPKKAPEPPPQESFFDAEPAAEAPAATEDDFFGETKAQEPEDFFA
jgi:hypothetical protein